MDPNTYFIIAVILAIIAASFLYKSKGKTENSKKDYGRSGFDEFGKDLTTLAEQKKIDPIEGRDEEVERAIHILLRRQKNNPLLLGEPGVGKTAIVYGLAQKIIDGDVPDALKGSRVLELDVNSLVSDTKFRGELEKRLRCLLESLEHREEKVILFIDEIHMLVQISGSEGSLNISDVLKPALARGGLQILGATTWDEYQDYIKPDAALDRRFQPILVDEPSQEAAIKMLKTLRPIYEEFHKVKISDEVIEAAVKLSDEKITGRYLPDKAIDLIDEASAKAAIESVPSSHAKAMGVVHAASKDVEDVVTVEDIESVVDQWIIHSKEEKKRDARVDH
jgi:ATP-dependent Clp protease ATP-binding subunit ClpC